MDKFRFVAEEALPEVLLLGSMYHKEVLHDKTLREKLTPTKTNISMNCQGSMTRCKSSPVDENDSVDDPRHNSST